MAIQVRRGLYKDFEPAKMLPGEWAVSIDAETQNQVVWMCFSAGVVKRMGTYEDFVQQITDATKDIKDEYMTEFNAVLDSIRDDVSSVSTDKDIVLQVKSDILEDYIPQMETLALSAEQSALASANSAVEAQDIADNTAVSATVAESYAVGGTGTRENEDVDNAKYYKEQAERIIPQALTLEINNVKGFVGYAEKGVLGIEWDVVNKTVTRLGEAIGKNPGADFDVYNMYGNRKKCIVTDTGKRLAYLEETGYTESGKLTVALDVGGTNYPIGTSVQVMVEQPAFWYKSVPIDFKKIPGRRGFVVQKIRYYISETARVGFKLHPTFYTREAARKPVRFNYLSAYEGCAYDVSASNYLLNDEAIVDFTATTGDKLSSIANAKPISGLTNDFTRAKARIIAKNRGTGWQLEDIFSNSASQLLFAIEYGSFDTQTKIGLGVANKSNGSGNESEPTGATFNIGNDSGMAVGTNGLVSVIYRGQENFWGNIWKWEDGLNVYADGVNNQAYIAYSGFADSIITDPYFDAGFELANTTGYISAIGWSEICDFAFLATETLGASNKPIEDYFYQAATSAGHKVSHVGGTWAYGTYAGGFVRSVNGAPSTRYRDRGGRVLFVPPIGLGDVDNTAGDEKSVFSASKLTTPRKIGNADFDGTKDITLEEIGAGGTSNVDDELSGTSENPVQNKVVTAAVGEINRRASNKVFPFISLDSSKYTIHANIFNGVMFVDATIFVPAMDVGSTFTIGTINDWVGLELPYICTIISIGQNIMSAILGINSNGTVSVTSQGAISGNNWFYGKSAAFIGYGFI